jgi:hypothetical protein
LIPPFPGSSLGVLNVVLRLILNVGSRLRQLRIADSLKFTLLQRHDFLADSNPLALAMIMILDTTFAHYSKEWGAMIGSAFDQGRVPSLQGRSVRN